MARQEVDDVEHRNEVVLVGRMAVEPTEQELPSGDVIVTTRLTVRRPPARNPNDSTTSDALACVARGAAARRALLAVAIGDAVEITGALRRRFFRVDGALRSVYEVDVRKIRRVRRATQLSA